MVVVALTGMGLTTMGWTVVTLVVVVTLLGLTAMGLTTVGGTEMGATGIDDTVFVAPLVVLVLLVLVPLPSVYTIVIVVTTDVVFVWLLACTPVVLLTAVDADVDDYGLVTGTPIVFAPVLALVLEFTKLTVSPVPSKIGGVVIL